MAKQYSLYQYVVWSLHGLSAYVILTDSSYAPSHTAGVRGWGAHPFANIMKIFFPIA